MINTWTWFIWIAAVLIALSVTRNPLYIILILLFLFLLDTQLALRSRIINGAEENSSIPVSPFRIALMLITLSAVFNAAISHYGETVLFSLPASFPLIGGSITLEAFVYGALNGLMLFGIFYAFFILNRALSVRRLIRVIPRAFYPVAVVTSIAITFIPNTIRQYHQIREAQSVRGHRMRGIRDWLPLIIPLLTGGLERALSLSESMSARGLAASTANQEVWWGRIMVLFGLLLLLIGWILTLFTDWLLFGSVLLISGIGLLLIVLWLIGRSTPHSTYILEKWTWQDALILSGVAAVISALLLQLPFMDQETLHYEVYPSMHLPGFDPFIGILLLGLLMPAIIIYLSNKSVQE